MKYFLNLRMRYDRNTMGVKINKKLNLDEVVKSLNFKKKETIYIFLKIGVNFILLVFIFNLVFLQIASATIYQPGETLEPDCAPGSSNCGVVTYPSLLGATAPIGNSLLSIEATSTDSILATLRAFVGQVANLFQVQNSGGINLFSINASGAAQFSDTLSVANNLTLNSLNGPLQANSGLVSATTSIGVLYGGTGLALAPNYGQLLIGDSSGGYTLTATSSLGLGGSSGTVSSIALTAPTGFTVSGSPVTTFGTLAISFASGYNLPLIASTTEYDVAYSNRITSVSSPLSITNHAISLSTAGDWTGTLDSQEGSYYLDARNLNNFGSPFYTFFNATTSDALSEGLTNQYFTASRFNSSFDTRFAATSTTALAEGSNLYFTNNRFDNRLSATTTLPNLTTLANLSTTGALTSGSIGSGFGDINIGSNTFTGNGSGLTNLNANNITNFGAPFYTFFSATTTDALVQGSTNKYYSDVLVNSYIHASSTIPKTYATNLFTGSNTFNGGLTLNSLNGPLQANSGLVSATTSIGVLYGGTGLTLTPNYGQLLVGNLSGGYTLTATSSLGLGGSSGTVNSVNASGGTTGLSFSGGPITASGTLTLDGILNVANGGTGATSFNQGWLFSSGGVSSLSASTSPTVDYITTTSTIATSTFAHGINIIGGCFANDGVCIGAGSGLGSDLQYASSYKPNDTFTNITSATTTLTTVAVTPSTATGDVMVRAGITFTSGNNTDQPISIAIRQTTCAGTTLESILYVVAATAGSEYYSLNLNYVAVDPGASSQTYAFCISTSAGDTDVSAWDMNATVIDTGADLAEIYTTNDTSLEAGDVVSYDFTLKTGVKKSMSVYDRNAFGIISTKPAMVIGGVDREGIRALPVALSGRVLVKVVTENGIILPGDYISPSSVLGVGMKSRGAGPVVGQAMSAYSDEGVGVIMAFVKNFDLGAIEQNTVYLEDISPKVNADGMDNGFSALISTIQSEIVRDPIAIIIQKIAEGKQFFIDFVAARVIAIRGYFDEVFAKKVHTEQICVNRLDGSEVCVNGEQINSLLQNVNIIPEANLESQSLTEEDIEIASEIPQNAIIETAVETSSMTIDDTALVSQDLSADETEDVADAPILTEPVIVEPQPETDSFSVENSSVVE